jgi:hypothetical protein
MTRVALFLMVLAIAFGVRAGGGGELVRVQDKGKATLWIPKPEGEGDPLQVKLSQVLTIVMRVEGEAPLNVEFSEKVRSSEGWHLERVGQPTLTALASGKRARWEQHFKATPLQPGLQPLSLPAVQITERDERPQDVRWTPLTLTIKTRVAKVDISEARDLAPIEELPPPVVAARPWWPWLFAALPVLAVGAWFLLGRRSRPLLESTPRDAALRQLDELAALPLATPADVDRLHTRLSDVLRCYLERRFDLPATRRTTPEFFAALTQESPLAAEQQALLSDILGRCDLAKFAGVIPLTEECQRLVSMGRAFVEKTTLLT